MKRVKVINASQCLGIVLGTLILGASTQCISAASIGGIGLYELHDHPDGNQRPPGYGLRTDELWDVTDGHDVFTFSFDAPGAEMYLDYDGTSIHIYGTAFGGWDVGSDYHPHSAATSYVAIDFVYSAVSFLPDDDDVVVTTPNFTNQGTLTWLDTGRVFDLYDFAGSHDYTFRFGNEDDDEGHRGFSGLSGWGWLNYDLNRKHVYSTDWLFTARLVPLPPAVFLGLAGIVGVAAIRRKASSRSL